MTYAVNNDLRTADGRIIVDIGILHVTIFPSGEITITSHGEQVFEMKPDGYEVKQPEPWINTLASIQVNLAERFGSVSLDQQLSH